MPAPYGFGVGDFIAVGTLAWAVFKSAKEAPESFKNIHLEVLSLHALTKEAEETIFKSPLPPERQARLAAVKDGCMAVLTDLDKLIKKYESLGTKSKRTWDRMQWGIEDVNEIRARLNTNVTLLAAFISTSQVSVEQKLDKLLQEFQRGKKEGSVISNQTVDSLTKDERAVWRTIRKELEDVGISLAAWQNNHDFILDWFVRMIQAGAFEEDAIPSSENRSSVVLGAPEHPPSLSQSAPSETQAPSTGNNKFKGQKDQNTTAQYRSQPVILEDTFMHYVVALRARSGNIGKSLSFARGTVPNENAINRLYNNMLKHSGAIEHAAAVSIDVLFAAFEIFVATAWKKLMGPLIEEDALQTLQTSFESSPDNFAQIFTKYLDDIAPQNRRCLAATISLLRDSRAASGSESERRDLFANFVKILVPAGKTRKNVILHYTVLYRLVDDYESLFENPEPKSASSEPLEGTNSSSLVVSNRLRKKSDPRNQQGAQSGLRSPSPSLQIPPPSAEESSIEDRLKDGKSTSVRLDTASLTNRPAIESISRITEAIRSFSRPKKRLLAAAGENNGASSLAAILAQHRFEKEALCLGLFKASEAGAVESMMLLVKEGADVNFVGPRWESTPLSAAVSLGHESAVEYLLTQGANVQYRNETVLPALYIATKLQSIPLMRVLVSAGATVNIEGYSELAPMFLFFDAIEIATPERPEAVEILIQAGAQIDVAFKDGGTPLMYALESCREKVVRVLIENGANVRRNASVLSKRGCTNPLESAVVANQPSQVKLLLEQNALTTQEEARRLMQFSHSCDMGAVPDISSPDFDTFLHNRSDIMDYIRDVIDTLP